jgi:putative transposase
VKAPLEGARGFLGAEIEQERGGGEEEDRAPGENGAMGGVWAIIVRGPQARLWRATEDDALKSLDEFEATWGSSHPAVVASWRRNWDRVRPFFAFPHEVRRILYTTNAIESLNFQLRKIIRSKGHFPSDEAATKLLFVALRNAEKKWKMPATIWKRAMNQLQIHFEDRLPA